VADTFEKWKNVRNSFKLPVKTVTLVPSTKGVNKPISSAEFQKRIVETKKKLISLFGGYTEVSGVGGFHSDDLGKDVEEKVASVTSFSQKDSFLKNKAKWIAWCRKKKIDWSQESIGIEIEGDLLYV
jgi:hypothetical protein